MYLTLECFCQELNDAFYFSFCSLNMANTVDKLVIFFSSSYESGQLLGYLVAMRVDNSWLFSSYESGQLFGYLVAMRVDNSLAT